MLKVTQLIGFGAGGGGEIAYFLGGVQAGTNIDAMKIDPEAVYNVSASLANAARGYGTTMSYTKGFNYNGGHTDGIIFSSETADNAGYHYGPSATTGNTYFPTLTGYNMGGDEAGTKQRDIWKFPYSTETRSQTAAYISLGRHALVGVDSTTRAYALGGYTTTYVNEIDGMIFSGETAFDLSITLTVASGYSAGFTSDTKGYHAGGNGNSTSYSTAIDGLIYSSNTKSDPSATLANGRRYTRATNSKTKGIIYGGQLSTGYTTDMERFTFSTETIFNTTAVLLVADGFVGSVQTGGIL